jgi:hypothetical protein
MPTVYVTQRQADYGTERQNEATITTEGWPEFQVEQELEIAVEDQHFIVVKGIDVNLHMAHQGAHAGDFMALFNLLVLTPDQQFESHILGAPGGGAAPNPYRTRFIKYCPNCKGDLCPEESHNRPPESSSSFRCDVCRRVFEINDHTK